MQLSSRLVLAALVAAAPPAWAQPDAPPPAGEEPASIDDEVAAALYDRGIILLAQGDEENAKKMFVESLERSPEGPVAADAIGKLAEVNERLGLPAEHGRPSQSGQVLDPYADTGSAEAGAPSPEEGVLDPYAEGAPLPPGEPPQDGSIAARNGLMLWSGLYGFTLGLAVGGPQDEGGELRGAAVIGGILGAGAGVAASYYLTRREPLTPGQAAAVASGGTWGAVTFGLLGDVFSGRDTATNTGYKYVAAGGLVGAGLGAWYALATEPDTGDVAFTNSLASYGGGAGLLLGVAIDPPRDEAYSLNAAIGTALGIGAGLYLRDHVEVSRRRTLLVDAGALGGAAVPWILLYPLIADDGGSGDEQITGLLSTLTLGGGAVAMWLLTGDDDGAPAEPGEAALPAVAWRTAAGRWQLGVPLPRPVSAPALAPDAGAFTVGLDLAAGRF